MKRFIYVGIAVLLTSVSASAEEFSEVEYYRQLQQAENTATDTAVIVKQPHEVWVESPLSAPEPPKNALIIMPQYHHSRNSQANFEVGGANLKMSKGRANGVSTTIIYNRRFTDLLSVAFMYEYAFMNVDGGMPMGRDDNNGGFEDSRWHSNVFGILPEFNFGKFGRLQLSYIAGFDRGSGNERYVTADDVDVRSIDSHGTNVTSLMAWYEKDFNLGCSNWKLTPYAGWRSLYVVVKDQNVWQADAGTRADSNLWAHLVSGGMKLAYQNGPVGFSLRGGINHRTSKDDLPGYASRAVAPGVVHFSHRANMDKTIGTVGAAISYAINERAIIGVGYDGAFGKDTTAHTATFSLVCPF